MSCPAPNLAISEPRNAQLWRWAGEVVPVGTSRPTGAADGHLSARPALQFNGLGAHGFGCGGVALLVDSHRYRLRTAPCHNRNHGL